jgi:hypothetical protein
MNNKINSKECRKLPITSFITGILSLTVFSLQALQMLFSNYLTTDTAFKIFSTIIVTILGIILPMVAIVCGSIDLAKIRKGFHTNKLFKAFDITGIVLGSIIFLIVSVFNLGPIIMHN